MGFNLIMVASYTGFWAVVAIIIPCFVPKGPNKGITQWCIILTSICCWMFWAICYISQMNPLSGPKLKSTTIWSMAKEWGYPISDA